MNEEEGYFPSYSPSLNRACDEPGLYAMRLTTGELFEFVDASPIDELWVRINFDCNSMKLGGLLLRKGMEVNVSNIVWVVDAERWGNRQTEGGVM